MCNQLYTKIAQAAKLTTPRFKTFLRKQHEPTAFTWKEKKNVKLTSGSRIYNHNNNTKTE